MHHEKLQQMIAFLEEEVRTAGYDYSADFLKIAASSLKAEATLTEETSVNGKSALESYARLQ